MKNLKQEATKQTQFDVGMGARCSALLSMMIQVQYNNTEKCVVLPYTWDYVSYFVVVAVAVAITVAVAIVVDDVLVFVLVPLAVPIVLAVLVVPLVIYLNIYFYSCSPFSSCSRGCWPSLVPHI